VNLPNTENVMQESLETEAIEAIEAMGAARCLLLIDHGAAAATPVAMNELGVDGEGVDGEGGEEQAADAITTLRHHSGSAYLARRGNDMFAFLCDPNGSFIPFGRPLIEDADEEDYMEVLVESALGCFHAIHADVFAGAGIPIDGARFPAEWVTESGLLSIVQITRALDVTDDSVAFRRVESSPFNVTHAVRRVTESSAVYERRLSTLVPPGAGASRTWTMNKTEVEHVFVPTPGTPTTTFLL
jgi:hypothetical protein